MSGIDAAKLVEKIRGQPEDVPEISALAAKLGVTADSIRPTLEALAHEVPPLEKAAARLAEMLGDEALVKVTLDGPTKDVNAGPGAMPATEMVATPIAEAAATAQVISATPATLVADCAAAAGGKLTRRHSISLAVLVATKSLR
jgi:hypothetical protein